MTKSQDFENQAEHRLHQSSPIFLFIDTVKEFILYIVIAIFAANTESWQLWAIVIACLLVIPRMVSVRFFKYWILPDEIVVKSGVFFSQERHIPYERVQNISQTQGILHRTFGVCKVQLESASGTKPEAEFNVISLAAVDEIRLACQGKAASISSSTGIVQNTSESHNGSQTQVLIQLQVPELIKHGLVTRQGWIPIAILLGFFSQQDEFMNRLVWPWMKDAVPLIGHLNGEEFSVSPILYISAFLGLIIFLLIGFILLSILVSLFRFYNFTLMQDAEKLFSEMGLLTRRSASAAKQRIQKITVTEGVLLRVFNRVTVTCKTAGNTRDSNNLSKSFHYMAPILPKPEVNNLLNKVQSEIDWSLLVESNDKWKAIPYRAWKRILKFPLLVCLLGAIATFYFYTELTLLFVPMVAFVFYNAQRSAKAMAYIYFDGYFAYRSGWITKQVSVIRIDKTQAVSLHQNSFDRRRDMARLVLDTAGFTLTDHNIDIRYLDFKEADALQKIISAQLNELAYEW